MGDRENAIDGALAMIDSERWGSARTRVVLFVKLNTLANPEARGAIVPIGYREVAGYLGLSARWTYRVLNDLVEQHVLRRVVEAAGSRGHAYVINEVVSEWEVPWAVPLELVEARVAWLAGALRAANPGVVPRRAAAQTKIVPRWSAAQISPTAALERGTNGSVVPRRGAAQTRVVDVGPPYSLDRELSFSRSSEANRVINAVAARLKAPVASQWADRIEVALESVADVDTILRGIAESAPGLRLPMMVTLVEQLAAHAQAPAPAAPAANGNGRPACDTCGGRRYVHEVDDVGAARVVDCPACSEVVANGATRPGQSDDPTEERPAEEHVDDHDGAELVVSPQPGDHRRQEVEQHGGDDGQEDQQDDAELHRATLPAGGLSSQGPRRACDTYGASSNGQGGHE